MRVVLGGEGSSVSVDWLCWVEQGLTSEGVDGVLG